MGDMLHIKSAGISDVGKKRKGNEDSLFLDDELGLYVVADGMGGHAAGEVASRLVVETVRDHMKGLSVDASLADPEPPPGSISADAARLLSGIRLANHVVHQTAAQNTAYHGMGSTVSAVYFSGAQMIAANVGDSPIYLVRAEAIRDLYVPHTVMAEYEALARKGSKKLGREFAHVLTRSMGIRPQVEPDIQEMTGQAGDVVVISSDGLSDLVSPQEILQVVLGAPTDGACRALVDLALQRGGHDNVTVIVLTVVQSPAAAEGTETVPGTANGATAKIAVEYDTEEASHRTFARDVSSRGIFIETTDPFVLGEEIWLTFSEFQGQEPFSVAGVVESRQPRGIRVKFDRLSRGQSERMDVIGKALSSIKGQ